MKKIILIAVLAMALLLVGCSKNDEDQTELPIETDEVVETSQATDEPSTEELDYNLPEHITMESIEDVVEVPIHYEFSIDGKDMEFKCGKLSFPAQLYVDETMALHTDEETDLAEELSVKDYFKDSNKQYMYVKTEGVLPGTFATTKHTLAAEVITDSEPYTLESLAEEYADYTITETVFNDAQAFIVQPDVEKHDSGFISTIIFVNVGTYDYGYGIANFLMDIYYEGGMADYSEVDFDEIENALSKLINIDFAQVN